MTDNDVRVLLEKHFMPPDTETERYLGLHRFSISHDVSDDRPLGCKYLHRELGQSVDLTLCFLVSTFHKGNQDCDPRFPDRRFDSWVEGDKTIHRRISRREFASIFEEMRREGGAMPERQ